MSSVSLADYYQFPTLSQRHVTFGKTCRVKPYHGQDMTRELKELTDSFEVNMHSQDAPFDLKDRRYAIRLFNAERSRKRKAAKMSVWQRILNAWNAFDKHLYDQFMAWYDGYKQWVSHDPLKHTLDADNGEVEQW